MHVYIVYKISANNNVDNCNHCSPINTSNIADGFCNSLNKVFIIIHTSAFRARARLSQTLTSIKFLLTSNSFPH